MTSAKKSGEQYRPLQAADHDELIDLYFLANLFENAIRG